MSGNELRGPEALNDQGSHLMRLGRVDEAISCYARAIEIRPDYTLALGNLGLALLSQERAAEAVAAYRRALALAPEDADLHHGLAAALAQTGRTEEAAGHYRRAVALKPDHAEALVNLGSLLRGMGQLDEALCLQRRAAGLSPGHAEILNQLGMTLRERNELPPAIACFTAATALRPAYTAARVNLALALLADGQFQRGSEEYEWRWRGYRDARLPAIAAPLWDGRALGNGTLLLWAEQGLGDTIQFARYAPLLRSHAGRIVLACPPPLLRLMRGARGIDDVVSTGAALPPADAYLPLLSLMHRLGTTLDTIPAEVPYLAAHPGRSAALAPLLAGEGLRVGLTWSGHPRHPNDHRRSLPPSLLRPLLDIPGIRYFALYPGGSSAAAGMPGIVDLSPHLVDLADTAAVVSALDLVISVDTAVAHLAGALARPTWLLLPFSADWRWLTARRDTPWYPTMRLFRQEQPGAWASVIAEIAAALRERVSAPAP